jgi:hypothetical protein
MKHMKRLSLIFILVLAVVTPVITPSCTNLDEEVFNDLTPSNFPQTRSELIAAFGSAYTTLYAWGQHNNYLAMTEVASDEAMIPIRGADWIDGRQWQRMHQHEYNSNEESINNAWNVMYRGVGISNSLIEAFKGLIGDPDSPVTDEEATLFIAELRGLRALYYYWLMDAWGNVPLVVDVEEGGVQDPNPGNTPRAEIYAFLVSELEAISGNLLKDKSTNTYGRFNYYAAQALLAKLYLNAETYTGTANWAGVVTATDNIINSGLYNLTPDYFDNFNADNDQGGVGTSESIFAIPFDALQAPGFNIGQMTLHYSSQATFQLQEQPWNGYCTLAEFYNSYEDGDARKGVWGDQQTRGNFLAGPQYNTDGVTPITDSGVEAADPDGPEVVFTPELNEAWDNALRQAGARIAKYEYEIGQGQHSNVDFQILRYADILLMKAEALWHQNAGSPDALAIVNQVRNRAGVDALASLTAEDLLAERGREMFYEGWRRNDLIRFGKYNDPWTDKPASDPSKNVFPLPQPKLNTNPNLQQNAGY